MVVMLLSELRRAPIPWHTRILGTLPLSKATMSTNSPRLSQGPRASTRVHSDRLANDKAIRYELTDGLAGVGVGDFVDFVGIKPDFALPAPDHRGRESLLSAEIDPEQCSDTISKVLFGRVRSKSARLIAQILLIVRGEKLVKSRKS